jgi:hypothetical protein
MTHDRCASFVLEDALRAGGHNDNLTKAEASKLIDKTREKANVV